MLAPRIFLVCFHTICAIARTSESKIVHPSQGFGPLWVLDLIPCARATHFFVCFHRILAIARTSESRIAHPSQGFGPLLVLELMIPFARANFTLFSCPAAAKCTTDRNDSKRVRSNQTMANPTKIKMHCTAHSTDGLNKKLGNILLE